MPCIQPTHLPRQVRTPQFPGCTVLGHAGNLYLSAAAPSAAPGGVFIELNACDGVGGLDLSNAGSVFARDEL
ncbi:MAG: hypothetical protein H6633_28450 [Anaerolineales bacterium]|nr:hypothetical protein [Anaerolineales bacterium]